MRDRSVSTFLEEGLPELDPIISHEPTEYGWRGLTQQGEVYEVKAGNGHPVNVPSEIIVAHAGVPIGRRAIRNEMPVDIDDYLIHFNRVVDHYKANRLEAALLESEATLNAAPTARAKFNRAMVLLAAGRWREGLEIYWQCEQIAPFMRPQVRAALDLGMEPWRGESLVGKRLVLQHAHGYGDSIMMLRYVPRLWEMGADVVLDLPPELRSLTRGPFGDDGDYFCPLLHLLHWLDVSPSTVNGAPYLAVDARLVRKWLTLLGPKTKRRVGIAWSIGKPSDGDYPREIPLHQLVAALGDAEIHSVQTQHADKASWLGVQPHAFEDFADCAALMMCMDEIISVDTAALHLAGAIGHPRLSHWSSWRWIAPWYNNMQICIQPHPGDWTSALAQIHAG
jgi:hypothetical protein